MLGQEALTLVGLEHSRALAAKQVGALVPSGWGPAREKSPPVEGSLRVPLPGACETRHLHWTVATLLYAFTFKDV